MIDASENPLLVASDLPYGLPRFDLISVDHYLPAFAYAIEEHLREVAAIVADPSPPSVENTLVALERSGTLLRTVATIFDNAATADATPEIQAIEPEVTRLLARHRDAIWLDGGLYARVASLHRRRPEPDPESAWLLERYHRLFVRAGARLGPAEQEELRRLNLEISELTTAFRTRLLADTNDLAVRVTSAAELSGLSEDAIAAAAEAARERGHAGEYLISLVLPTPQPSLASLDDRGLRERIHRASISRGARGNANDTSGLIASIVALRARRARLLGYASHAEFIIEDSTAGSVEAVTGRLHELAAAAVRNAEREAADLQQCAGDTITLEAWDWAYYTEKRRRERYAIDEAEIRPYFALDRVLRDGVFFAAERLYGLRFSERPDLPAYHPDAEVFEVFGEDGGPLGLFIADFYTRDSKQGGAWSRALIDQSTLLGTAPIVINNLNLNKPPAGEPTLLKLDEVRTVFHEFGHALHALLSAVRHPMFAHGNVPRDFVEYPSQINELWMLWPEVLANYARHHVTGEPLPAPLADRLRAAQSFNQGFRTTELLAAALLDLAWHSLGEDTPSAGEVARFETEALERAGVLLPQVPTRYRSTYFKHVFGGDYDYSAAYYSYIWSEILDADTAAWFTANGGLRRENGAAFEKLLAKGSSMDPVLLYRDFRGRDPDIEPLLIRRGLM